MDNQSLRLISWNVGGRTRQTHAQIEALLTRQADIIALQEVTAATRESFMGMAPFHTLDTSAIAARIHRKNFNLIASRWPVQWLAPPTTSHETWVPYPERVLSTEIQIPWGLIELHNVHIPDGSGHGWDKIYTFEDLYARLALPAGQSRTRVLVGDCNAPQQELTDGRILTADQWQDSSGEIKAWSTWCDKYGRCDTGDRWDRAERSVLVDLARFGLPDVFRTLHDPAEVASAYSHVTRGGHKRRYDHVFASPSLRTISCEYLHDLDHLSDHTPVMVVFQPESSAC